MAGVTPVFFCAPKNVLRVPIEEPRRGVVRRRKYWRADTTLTDNGDAVDVQAPMVHESKQVNVNDHLIGEKLDAVRGTNASS